MLCGVFHSEHMEFSKQSSTAASDDFKKKNTEWELSVVQDMILSVQNVWKKAVTSMEALGTKLMSTQRSKLKK